MWVCHHHIFSNTLLIYIMYKICQNHSCHWLRSYWNWALSYIYIMNIEWQQYSHIAFDCLARMQPWISQCILQESAKLKSTGFSNGSDLSSIYPLLNQEYLNRFTYLDEDIWLWTKNCILIILFLKDVGKWGLRNYFSSHLNRKFDSRYIMYR